MNSTIKNLLIVVGIILVLVAGIFAYSTYFTDEGKDTLLVEEIDTDFPGKDISDQLERIKSLDLENGSALFNDPAYQSLVDSTVILPVEATGRANPFAPTFRAAATPVKASTR